MKKVDFNYRQNGEYSALTIQSLKELNVLIIFLSSFIIYDKKKKIIFFNIVRRPTLCEASKTKDNQRNFSKI